MTTPGQRNLAKEAQMCPSDLELEADGFDDGRPDWLPANFKAGAPIPARAAQAIQEPAGNVSMPAGVSHELFDLMLVRTSPLSKGHT
jgi:hypothetical protein